ncbi:MAG: hypothetical protein WC373_10015 [Smithella sp.]|jgi:hypothetical protein
MAWKVELDAEHGCIHTVYSGIVTKNDIVSSMTETLRMISGKGPQKFLSEWIDATSKLSTIDIFNIPGEWESSEANQGSVLALVVQKNAKSQKDAQFYENACVNRGWRVRIFTQRNDAIEWLKTQKIATEKKT